MNFPRLFDRSPWGLVVVSGPDATSFLQAIVSQDLEPVDDGETVASLLLAPQGKLDVAFRATRRDGADGGGDGGVEWWLDTDPAFGRRLAQGLGRYKIRVKVGIDERTASTGLASLVTGAVANTVPVPGELLRVPTNWGVAEGIDVLGPIEVVRAWVAANDAARGSPEEFEVLRIETGVPKLGVDVDERTIPQEAFLEAEAVSFTKGCFIGQELVCRIDSRGHVNRFLRRLMLDGSAVPPADAEVVVGQKVVGQITSAAAVPGEDRAVALAMVRREVEPPAELAVRWPDHEIQAHLVI